MHPRGREPTRPVLKGGLRPVGCNRIQCLQCVQGGDGSLSDPVARGVVTLVRVSSVSCWGVVECRPFGACRAGLARMRLGGGLRSVSLLSPVARRRAEVGAVQSPRWDWFPQISPALRTKLTRDLRQRPAHVSAGAIRTSCRPAYRERSCDWLHPDSISKPLRFSTITVLLQASRFFFLALASWWKARKHKGESIRGKAQGGKHNTDILLYCACLENLAQIRT